MLRTDHVAVPVSDMEAAIQFYVSQLGLTLLSREVDPVHQEEFSFLELAGGNLELLKNLAAPHERPSLKAPYCPHLALATDNMAETLVRLEQNGIRVIKGPMKIDGQVTWLYIADPDNNVIEFVQWLK